jgi:hypothetical protein
MTPPPPLLMLALMMMVHANMDVVVLQLFQRHRHWCVDQHQLVYLI